jgi:uncharacterized protein YndB with AHSA1/START domain
MADILQDFPIQAPPQRVFDGVSQPALLDAWWTLRARGEPKLGAIYEWDFGPQFLWRAVVTACEPGVRFAWRITEADQDWTGTELAFELEPIAGGTQLRFAHRGWREPNAHFRTTSHCWALYLRLLRRHLERGETVPYAQRLEA